jgi:hypothetical protein
MPSVESPAAASQTKLPAPLSGSKTNYWVPLAIVWLFSVAWMWHFLLRQWVPHDEGLFADTANRILLGEVPHRDFLDAYTGLLGYFQAAGWKLFGRDLAVFRYELYAVALAWVPALYYIGTRFVRTWIAAALVAIAVVWSLPNYAAPVPSWYNLFLATFGTAALLRYAERRSRRWLFAAGLCGGVSFLFKVTGLFFVFATALFLVYRSQDEPSATCGRFAVFLRIAITLAVVLIVVRVVSGYLTQQTVGYFIGPAVVVAVVLLGRESRIWRARTGGAGTELLVEIAVVAAGVLLPIALFLLIYLHGGIIDFIRGVFILPMRRLQYAQSDPPPFGKVLVAAIAWVVCGLLVLSRRRAVQIGAAALIVLDIVLAFSRVQSFHYIWRSLSCAIPPAAVISAFICLRRSRPQLFLLMAVTVLCSLVQFPFGAAIYFCYILPLVVMLIAALFATRPHISRVGVVVVLGAYLFAGIALINPGDIYTLGDYYDQPSLTGRLQAPGAQQLEILPGQAELYNAMIPVVQEHARGEYVYASPSAPEVYFLADRRNPVPWMFDFFDDRSRDVGFTAAMLNAHAINVVVINLNPDFDPAPTTDMMAMYQARYPHSERFGRFEVRWRE